MKKLFLFLFVLAPAVAAQDSLPPTPSALRKIPPAEIAALNARVDALEKTETLGNVIFWAGQIKWIVFAGGIHSSGAALADLALLGISETGMAMDFYANTRFRSMYRSMGGEESFVTGTGTGWYVFSKTLLIAGVGLVTAGLINKDGDDFALGGAAIVFNDLIDAFLWLNLHKTNRELKDGIRNWNLGAGLDPRGAPRLSLNYFF